MSRNTILDGYLPQGPQSVQTLRKTWTGRYGNVGDTKEKVN